MYHFNKEAKIRGFKALLIGAAATLVTLTAQADQPLTLNGAGEASLVVNFSDLNLDTPAGVQSLYARLSRAAGRVCGGNSDPRDLAAKEQFRTCHAQAMNTAVAQVDSQRLQVLHANRVATHKTHVG
jgi:UrcA family protein